PNPSSGSSRPSLACRSIVPPAQRVAQARGLLVVFVGHGPIELLAQGSLDAMLVSQRLLDLSQVLHHAVFLHLLFGIMLAEERAQAFQAGSDRIDGAFRILAVHALGGSSLRALEENEAAVLLVGLRVFLVRRILTHEIHERQRVVGIAHGPAVLAQRQPANAAVIVLHELAVRFGTVLL